MDQPVARRFPFLAIFLAGLALGAVVVLRILGEIAYADRIYPGVSALGVDLGGLTVDAATDRLHSALASYEARPLSVQAGDQSVVLTPRDLGFRPDAAALARASYAAGRKGDLLHRLGGPLTARALAVPIADDAIVDDATLDQAIQGLARQANRPVQNAELLLSPTVALKPSQAGQRLDEEQARDAARRHLLARRTDPLVLPVARTEPRVTTAQLEPLRDQAMRLIVRPVALVDGQQRWALPAAVLRSALVVHDDPPSLDLTSAAFERQVEAVARQIERPAHDARIVIANGKVTVEPDQPGRAVDLPSTLVALREKLLAGELAVPVVVYPVTASVTAADLAPLAAEASKDLARGLVLVADGQEFPLGAAQLGDLMVVQQTATSGWKITLDRRKLQALLTQINERFAHPTLDARFGWEKGKLKVLQPQVPATMIDQPKALAAVLEEWEAGRVDLPTTVAPLRLDDAVVARLGADLKEVIQERATSFVGSIPERAHNIALALSRINGTYVAPGATFSFNRAVGPTTLAAGFQWGFAYSTDSKGASQVVPSVAGGICQVATTTFQPVFWAGYQIEERHWHMFVMKRYADHGYLGLDATVSPEDGLDFKFTNNAEHALLILAWTEGQQAHVSLVGTRPDWLVKVDPEQISNVVPAPAGVLRTTSPHFARGREIVLEEAQDGLTSHVVRHVIYSDGHERTLSLTSDYQPAQRSILVGTG